MAPRVRVRARDRGYYWRKCSDCGQTGVCACPSCFARTVEAGVVDLLAEENSFTSSFAFNRGRSCHSCYGFGRLIVSLPKSDGAADLSLADRLRPVRSIAPGLGSLTGQLRLPANRSPLRAWMDRTFPLCSDMARNAGDAASGVMLHPPTGEHGRSSIGTAFEHRVAMDVVGGPGPVSIATSGAILSYLSRTEPMRPRALWAEPIELPEDAAEMAFFRGVRSLFPGDQPQERARPTQDLDISRAALVLGLFTEAGRLRRVADGSPLASLGPHATLDDLLGAIPDEWVVDLSALAATARDVLGFPTGRRVVVNPILPGSALVGGADADLVLDGCLIELKVSAMSRVNPAWLRQLLAYLLLDRDDQLAIRRIGIYLARHGVLIEWDVEEYLQSLSGAVAAPDLEEARREFWTFLREAQRDAVRATRTPPPSRQ